MRQEGVAHARDAGPRSVYQAPRQRAMHVEPDAEVEHLADEGEELGSCPASAITIQRALMGAAPLDIAAWPRARAPRHRWQKLPAQGQAVDEPLQSRTLSPSSCVTVELCQVGEPDPCPALDEL